MASPNIAGWEVFLYDEYENKRPSILKSQDSVKKIALTVLLKSKYHIYCELFF
ncbi:hypothetical protein HMPREF0072_1362 [Anaerococcus lactolyticus ATCC 51172]|uniref:Uncharacterized protein n=1 Tax=Anaerococcus lactolyticus ATCC 51172 TaxID=525254 RepID=C2BG92_9FIRM|nr:hypothetical protein HMPREF0072_1362 [Anaerococcus lactolyticus ATCC 51172]